MKKLLALIVILSPIVSFAQERSLIFRIDGQSGEVVSKTGRIGHLIIKRPSAPPELQSAKSFSISLRDTSVQLPAGGSLDFLGTMTNLAGQPVKLIFERTHLVVDSNVSAGICDLCNCYSDSKDSLSVNQACSLPTGIITQKFSYTAKSVKGMTATDSLVDYVKITALTGDAGDTMSFTIKTMFVPENGITNTKASNTVAPKITSIYPSPLTRGNAINLKISSPRENTFSYSIFDGIGRTVGFGVTKQHIVLGGNTISIGSLDGIPNGTYLLKLDFSDGSSDAKFFQVMR